MLRNFFLHLFAFIINQRHIFFQIVGSWQQVVAYIEELADR